MLWRALARRAQPTRALRLRSSYDGLAVLPSRDAAFGAVSLDWNDIAEQFPSTVSFVESEQKVTVAIPQASSALMSFARLQLFGEQLGASVEHWRQEGKAAAWLSLPLDKAEYAAVAQRHGFRCHHAARDGSLSLVKWLADAPDRIPPYATHRVGVGAAVVREEDAKEPSVLVVKENREKTSGWKLPGGLADWGEDFGKTAAREVEEETGIKCDAERVSLLGVRHMHEAAFGVSDLYFVAQLSPLSVEFRIDTHELREARWMPISEYVEATAHHEMNHLLAKILQAEVRADQHDGPIVEIELPHFQQERPPFKFYHGRFVGGKEFIASKE